MAQYKVTDQQVLAVLPDARNMHHLLQLLGIAAYGGNYTSMRLRLGRLGVLEPQFDKGEPYDRHRPGREAEHRLRLILRAS